MKRFFLLMILFLGVASIQAQEQPIPTPTQPPARLNSPVRAEFAVDNQEPLLGEPFNVTILIRAPADVEILSWVTFNEPMEMLVEGDVLLTTEVDSAFVLYERTYTVVLWEVGEYLSEGALIVYQLGADTGSTPVSSFYVQVPSQISNPDDVLLRPSAEPIDLPYISPWIFVGVVAIMIIVGMIIARLLQISRQGVVQIVTASPADKAIAELEDLKDQQLPASTIYELVANNLRQYIEDQFAVEAVEMTTVELMGILRQRNLFPKNHRQQLQDVLEQSDLVKFARFQPDKASSLRLVNYAIKWLRETERLQEND
ncbi:MAG: hypothetical protein Phog2KO_01760 [Phototrophicaceae bacterium]